MPTEKANVTAKLRIKGAGAAPAVDGTVRLEDGASVTALMPDEGAGLTDARQTVTFIGHDDTLALRRYLVRPKVDSTQKRLAIDQIGNMTVNLALEATDKSEVTIVIDPLNGDNLRG